MFLAFFVSNLEKFFQRQFNPMSSTIMPSRFKQCRYSLLLAAVFLFACGSGELDHADLEGSTWELTELFVMGGYEFSPEVPGDYTLRFESDNRLRGNSDCNTFTGSWEAGESFAITSFEHTRSMCLSGSIHNFYVLYLPDVVNLIMEDEQLVATTTTDGVRLVFQPAT